MEKLLIIPFVLHLLDSFLQISAYPQTTTESFIIHYLENRQIIPVRIQLNTNAQTEHVTSIAGETLYDFNVRKVAYKDTNSSQCFIADIVEESIESDRRRLKNLENGVVRGFYLPTFIIHEELNNTSNLTQNFGILLAEFCSGNSISLVVKQSHRRKRDTSKDGGQFTHHAYGHYGHQSNNYAHYGHETYITGTTDENGQIRNQKVNHQQIRSESSHVYPGQGYGNGRQDTTRTTENTAQRPAYTNGPQSSNTGSRTRAHFPQTHYQTQQRMPSYQQAIGNGRNVPRIGGTGQFSLQSSHEGGYQLSLPLGLQAGNIYRGGVLSAGQYGVGGTQPHMRTDFHQYPESTRATGYQTYDQRQPYPLPTVSRPSDHSTLQGITDLDRRKLPSPIQPGITVPAVSTAGDRRVLLPAGVQTSDTQIPFTAGDRRQQGIDYDSQQRRQIDHGTIPSAQITPSSTSHTLPHTRMHPASGIPSMGHQVSGQESGIGRSVTQMPSGIIQSPLGVPGQISTIPASDISGTHRVTGVSRPSQIHGTDQESRFRQQQFIPSGSISPQYLQTPDGRQTTDYKFNGDSQKRPAPSLLTPGIDTSYPSTVDASKEKVLRASLPGSPAISSIPHTTLPTSYETIRNGIRYPDDTRPQRPITDAHPSSGSYPGESRLPIDSTRIRPGGEIPLLPTGTGPVSQEAARGRVLVASRPGETIPDSRYNLSIPSTEAGSETSAPFDKRIISRQTGFEASRIYGQDSASSQTQIQTGLEGTAAEASAAGHYRGLGSQTQVQGGYAGNGSFSAQAQSGFTGGVVQSQVQGGKKGGLSGSSAQVERVGSAQSQVQVLQPSGSASSTAQGRFTGGTTQVQAQSSKKGGSAGAQAQSTGLSSSHVQVNIGGNDVSQDENFQGTVSASVHGGQSAGQSQTQLQGGYDSGRTYAATAQGGFDTALDFQAAVPSVGGQPLLTSTGGQESQGVIRDQHQTFGVPPSVDGAQQSLRPSFPEQQTHFGLQLPGTQDRTVHEPESQRQTYPSLPTHMLTGAPDQHFIQRYPPSYHQIPGYYPQSQPGTTFDSRYKPSFPSIPQQPVSAEQSGIQQRYPLPSHLPDQTHVLRPSSQTIPPHIRPGEVPVLKRPDGSLFTESTQHQLPMPDLTRIQPEQPQFLFPSPQLQPLQPLPPIQAQYPSISSQRPQTPPGQSLSPIQPHHPPTSHQGSQIQPGQTLQPSTQTRPDQTQIYHPSPQSPPGQPLSAIQPHHPSISFQGSQIQPGQTLQPSTQTRPSQAQIYYPSPQILPGQPLPPIQPHHPPISFQGSQIQPGQILQPSAQTRPDQAQIYQQSSQISPGQPLPPIQPHHPPISYQGSQIQPGQTLQPSTQIRPGQAQIYHPSPQISTTTEKIPIAIPSEPTGVKADRVPGVSEPDKRDCCAALRDLKRRCCGGTSTQDKMSSCCRPSSDDIFDFSTDDDLDQHKEPCKVVKAICYIVYKPVGKARVCKPTATNGC